MKPGERNKRELLLALRSLFPVVEVEHRFHPVRRWRFDFAVPSEKLAVEYNGHGQAGGGHIGRHASLTGMAGDCEKLNAAQALGWTVLQFTALHFREADRRKHRLTAPLDAVTEALRYRDGVST